MLSVNKYFLFLSIVIAGCVGTDTINDPEYTKGKLKITLASPNVLVNDSLKLSAEYLDYSGKKISGTDINWTSSNENIAKVNNSGYLAGVTPGQATIYASASYFEKDSLLITVVGNTSDVSSIIITGGRNNLNTGDTLMLNADAYNFNGNKIDNITFNWNSSNNSVLTVNSTGTVKAISAGTAFVTVAANGISSSPYQISVTGKERTGSFEKNPSQDHVVSGKAILKENFDGTLTLEFDSTFASSGGPDVRVYLSVNQSTTGNSFEVGTLKSTSGKQLYDIPSSININDYNWVLIHCVPFNITFGWAKLN